LPLPDPRRLLVLLLIPACIGLAACGGGEESPPDTQVIVPTETPSPDPASSQGDSLPTMPGYLISADNEKVMLLTETGEEQRFDIASEDFQNVGVPHLASHAGLTELGFLVTYEERDGRLYIKAAQEIDPPFPFPAGGS
jgi:hypothetical protein